MDIKKCVGSNPTYWLQDSRDSDVLGVVNRTLKGLERWVDCYLELWFRNIAASGFDSHAVNLMSGASCLRGQGVLVIGSPSRYNHTTHH